MKRAIIAVVMVVALNAVTSVQAQNTVTFDNQSGETALVKLIGPTSKKVEVPNATKQNVEAFAGCYTIKVRYGTPGRYRYSKGQEFEVKETATTASAITISLHKVKAGNYDSRPITEKESSGSSEPKPGRDSHAEMAPIKLAHGSKQDSRIMKRTELERAVASSLLDGRHALVTSLGDNTANGQVTQTYIARCDSPIDANVFKGKFRTPEAAETNAMVSVGFRVGSPFHETRHGDLGSYGRISVLIEEGKAIARRASVPVYGTNIMQIASGMYSGLCLLLPEDASQANRKRNELMNLDLEQAVVFGIPFDVMFSQNSVNWSGVDTVAADNTENCWRVRAPGIKARFLPLQNRHLGRLAFAEVEIYEKIN